MKSKGTAYLLWLFLGFFGGHCFYLGKVGKGILYLCTLGVAGIGWLIDLFTLGKQVDMYNVLHSARGNANTNTNMNNIVINMPPQGQQNATMQTDYSATSGKVTQKEK